MDRDLGLIHVKVQTWFPFRIQVYVNGHEWLARQMDRQQMPYVKLDNAFFRVNDVEKTQRLADGFERVDWVHVLDGADWDGSSLTSPSLEVAALSKSPQAAMRSVTTHSTCGL